VFVKTELILAAAAACWALATPAIADPPDGAANARFHLGPVGVTPTIALTNLGVDNNVFNEADVNHPKSDMTATVTPAADLWMRAGSSWVTASVREDLVYYRTYASERSVNGAYKASLLVPLNRLAIHADGGFISTRDRPGFEIDARSQHNESVLDGGVEVRAFGKTFLAGVVQRSRVAFDRAAVYMGTNLQTELNRTMTMVGVSARHEITPVTSVTLNVDTQQDRFDYSPYRDSDSTRVMAGIRFGARLAGSAAFGYQQFRPLAADLPDYRGPIARVDMALAVVGGTQVGVHLARNVDYSYEFDQPYYVGTGGQIAVTQALFGPLDVVVRGGLEQMAYRGRLTASVPPDRTDEVASWGGGIGYRVGPGMRVGLNIDQQQRRSDVAGHSYGGLRFGTSVTYGF